MTIELLPTTRSLALEFEQLAGGVTADRLTPSRPARAAKRAIDLVGATVALCLALPAILVIAVAVRCTSAGPVLFRQERVGRGGRTFRVLKFRTMRDGTDREVRRSSAEWAAYVANDFKLAKDDARVTPVGRFLRVTSLDELPQLINVIAGHMSLVGIRPLVPEELELRPPAEQACYRAMRPGLTGLWQVEGRSTISHVDRRALDTRYVANWSIWSDLKILVRTPIAVARVRRAC